MFRYIKFRRKGYSVILREDARNKFDKLLDDPEGFIKKHISRTYLTAPNLVAEISFEAGEKAIVKSFGWRSKFHFLLSPFRRSKAMRSFNTAQRLLEKGVFTPAPLCVIERRFMGFILKNIYITECIEDYITVREYLQKQPEGYESARKILPYLAEYVRKIHDAGVWHRDLHLTNFLMKKNSAGIPYFYIVDLNRARMFKTLPFIFRIFDIGKMDLHEFRADFLDYYLYGVRNKVSMEKIFYIYVILRRIRRRVVRGR